MRLLVAAIVGGIVMFVWQAVAHMALPIGEMGMKTASGQETAIAALQASATDGGGVYMLPGMSPEQWADEKAKAAFQEQYKSSPYAFVVYRPEGNPALVDMVPNLAKQFVSDVIAAFLVAWVLALGAFGFGKRVLIAGALGLFAWLAISVPYWNWYLFPVSFTVGALVEQVVGWLLAGVAIAWWLGRAERRA
ncbi:MAG TPA: hypothetical protein VJ806_05800 [Luteimonas sp.]|nr:hypothetical protein [Luteimonas sp.]